jgi:hypothetical protein
MTQTLKLAVGYAVTARNELVAFHTLLDQLVESAHALLVDDDHGPEEFAAEQVHKRLAEMAKILGNYRQRLEEDIRRLDPDALPVGPVTGEQASTALRDALTRMEEVQARAGVVVSTTFRGLMLPGETVPQGRARLSEEFQRLAGLVGSNAATKAEQERHTLLFGIEYELRSAKVA